MARKNWSNFIVSRPDEIPAQEHWAIIKGSSITIPGDLRSITNPGHGYPEHTEHALSYECFTDKEEFELEVRRLMLSGNKNWKSVHVLPVEVKIDVTVK